MIPTQLALVRKRAHHPHLMRILYVLAMASVLVAARAATAYEHAMAFQAGNCVSDTRSSYTVTICLTTPSAGSVVSGITPVQATISVTGANPGVRRLIFYVDNQYALTAFGLPYAFDLPTNQWVDGAHILSVEALLRDNFTTSRAAVNLTFANGVSAPPVNNNSFQVTSGFSNLGRPLIVAATGDGGDGQQDTDDVVNTISSVNPDIFLFLGDVYEQGSITEFYNWYGVQGVRYGRFRSFTNPTVGNHEYDNGVAQGYFNYWDNIPDYYSYDAAGWHFVSLNSTSQFGEVAPGAPQYNWLQQDLASSQSPCTVVYFHHPVFSTGPQGDTTSLNALWSLLYQYGVDVVLAGHEHSYQRWLPLDQNGNVSNQGIVHFVAGGGGHGIQNFVRTDARLAIGYDNPATGFGALRFEMNPKGAAFQYIHTSGAIIDAGVIPCRGATPDTQAPTTPQNLLASADSSGQIVLQWQAAQDDTGVALYRVYRNGQPIADVDGYMTSFTDGAVMFNSSYSYWITAVDPAGNSSGQSNQAEASTANRGTLVLNPIGDAYVNAGSPTSNYGGIISLRADASPTTRSYLRFNVQGIIGQINRVTLRVYTNNGSGTGYSVRLLNHNNWSELTTNYNNAPGMGAAVGSSGPFISGVWTEVDLTALVTANGMLDLGIDTSSNTAISLASRESLTPPELVIEMGSSAPTPPTAPGNVAATLVNPGQVDVTWSASQDESGIASYQIYRNGDLLATVDGATLSYADTTVQSGALYDYTMTATGNSGAISDPSPRVSVAIPSSDVVSFAPVADAYVSAANSGSNYGASTTLRADASPDIRSYMRFEINGISRYISNATLYIYSNSNSSAGYEVRPVGDNTWLEAGLTYNNAPTFGPVVNMSGVFSKNAWTSVDVTSLISGNGVLNLAITGASSTGISFRSRESSFPPRLDLTLSGVAPTPTPTPMPTPVPTATSAPTPGTLTFSPTIDAYVNAANPASNYGSSASLRVDASPVTQSFLRFDVQGLVGSIVSATLRVYANSGSSAGYQVRPVSENAWTELGVTSANAPAVGAVAGASGSFSSGVWTSVDVTALVTGNGSLNLALTGSSNTGIAFDSREGINLPELVITTAAVAAASPADSTAATTRLQPDASDADGDGLSATDERLNGTSDHSADTDGDQMPDLWEVEIGLNPIHNEAMADEDGDDASNVAEFLAGTDPYDDQNMPGLNADHVLYVPLLLRQ